MWRDLGIANELYAGPRPVAALLKSKLTQGGVL
jgi:hypothetical protein